MTSSHRLSRLLPAVALGVALVGTGCGVSATPAAVPAAGPRGTAEVARQQLTELSVRARTAPRDYDRDAFGPSWEDVDGNGCNQRDDVLLRDVEPGTVKTQRQGSCDHDVLAGTWTDPYSGRSLTFTDLKDPAQAQAIQIDHVVPLAEAWASGASAWSDASRLAFANDLAVLLAADGPTNASKGASDPADWRPRKNYQCRYAIRWIGIKTRWALTVDQSEVAALKDMLSRC